LRGRSEKDDLLFLPLGGCGEIGMNLNLYRCDGKWLMVDLGMTFAGENLPGIDLIFPDPAYIVDKRQDLIGLVLTHGHEDHIGAVPYLWPQLGCPIYATPFTAELVRRKLVERDLLDAVDIREMELGASFEVGPFGISYVALAHSIAEGNALKIETSHGTIFHTGDWKLDEGAIIGRPASSDELGALGDEGILAMVGDSTNVFNELASGSETAVAKSLKEIISQKTGRVVVTTFASNVARLQTVGSIAQETGRRLALLGRSMRRVYEAARATGYLRDFPEILGNDQIKDTPRDKLLVLTTGCQGEPRAALSRIATGEFRSLSLSPDDTVIFSSKIIPGNEHPIGLLVNRLVLEDIEVITEHDAFVHVSGHPGQPELRDMYGWIRPQIAIPVHGEARHIKRHAELATEVGVPRTLRPLNGDLVRLAPEGPELVDQVPTGRLVLDGEKVLSITSEPIAERRQMLFAGHLGISLALDDRGRLILPAVLVARGIPGWKEECVLEEDVRRTIKETLASLDRRNLLDDLVVEEAVRIAVRRVLREDTGKKPVTVVRVLRITT
jgi:ribonuclease J